MARLTAELKDPVAIRYNNTSTAIGNSVWQIQRADALVFALPDPKGPESSQPVMTHEASDTQGETSGCSSAPATNAKPEENRHLGTVGNAPENEELAWARQHVPDDPATLIVERKTELIGWGVPARKRERQLTTEAMIDRVVIPVIERMQKDLIRRIDALDARISALELVNRSPRKRKQSGAGERGEQK